MHHCFQRLYRDVRGSTAVEMAFAVPIFLIFLFGIIGAGHMYWVYNSIQYGLDQAGRYAMIHPTATDSAVEDVVFDHAYSIRAANLTVTSVTNPTPPTANRVITANYSYDFLSSVIGFSPTTLTVQTTVPIIP